MAGLAPVVDSLDKVPEGARTFYEQKDGKYHLNLDGTPTGFVPAADLAAANGRVVEFRDKNVALMQEVEPLRKLKTDVGDLDINAARVALTKVGELEKKGVKGADDLTAAITAAAEAAVKPVREALAAAQQESLDRAKKLEEKEFNESITKAFIDAGGKPSAAAFVVNEARGSFEVKDGKVVAKSTKFSAVTAGAPLPVSEWLTDFAKSHDYVFEPSGGAGARKVDGASTLKPGQTVLKDPTPQQLGEHAKDIASGKMKVEYSNA